MYGLWLFLHLTGVVIWVGGMFFVMHCLGPAVADLQPQQRAPLMIGALGRFYNLVLIAVALIWISGLAMLIPIGFKAAPLGWHVMLGLGTVMTVIYLYLRFALFPRAAQLVAGADLPGAAGIMSRMRTLVMVNMVLGFIVIASVSLLH